MQSSNRVLLVPRFLIFYNDFFILAISAFDYRFHSEEHFLLCSWLLRACRDKHLGCRFKPIYDFCEFFYTDLSRRDLKTNWIGSSLSLSHSLTREVESFQTMEHLLLSKRLQTYNCWCLNIDISSSNAFWKWLIWTGLWLVSDSKEIRFRPSFQIGQ